jgi:tyrosine-protein phosphatase YwqE
MFSFFKKSKTNFENLQIDFHNHILPGIDDGAKDANDSYNLRIGLQERGFEKCVYTPHIYTEIHPNNPESISNAYNTLFQDTTYSDAFKSDRFAAEYMIDENFKDALNNNKSLLCIKDKKVLIEFSTLQLPFFAEETIFNLRLLGYTPIIAHPERYNYMFNNTTSNLTYTQLKDMGCEFQLNLLSLVGMYGNISKQASIYLLKNQLYDYAATDVHNSMHLRFLDKLIQSSVWNKWSKYPFKNQNLI